jgi:hypothetical protein
MYAHAGARAGARAGAGAGGQTGVGLGALSPDDSWTGTRPKSTFIRTGLHLPNCEAVRAD